MQGSGFVFPPTRLRFGIWGSRLSRFSGRAVRGQCMGAVFPNFLDMPWQPSCIFGGVVCMALDRRHDQTGQRIYDRLTCRGFGF